jgi:hypothetical protein
LLAALLSALLAGLLAVLAARAARKRESRDTSRDAGGGRDEEIAARIRPFVQAPGHYLAAPGCAARPAGRITAA